MKTVKRGYLDNDFELFYIEGSDKKGYKSHYHDFHKMIIFIDGRVNYYIEGSIYELTPNDVLIVKNHEVHNLEIGAFPPYKRVVVYLNPIFLEHESIDDMSLLSCFSVDNDKNLYRMNDHDIFKRIIENHMNDEKGKTILTKALILEMLVKINRLDETNNDDFGSIKRNPNVSKIIDYIGENLTTDLRADNIAEMIFMNKHYMMRFFKKQTGHTIHNYITEKRLINVRELIKKGRSISDAAYESGFKDYSSFSRAFKKRYGKPPKSYKDK